MKKVFILLITFLLISSLYGKNQSQYLEFSPETTLRTSMNLAMQRQGSARDSTRLALYSHPDYILPKKALFFSALIPGAGELYCKSYLRSLVFFGIEVGTWALYANYHKKGEDKEDEYIKYADEHWNEGDWRQWFDRLDDTEQKVFSHSLPEDEDGNTVKTQQYYEMIGKYDQFLVGWDDAEKDLSTSEIHEDQYDSQNRLDYMDMRYDSNQMFKRATNCAFVVMFNHILSAIDAAWIAKSHNRNLIRTSLRIEQMYLNSEYNPVLTLKVNW